MVALPPRQRRMLLLLATLGGSSLTGATTARTLAGALLLSPAKAATEKESSWVSLPSWAYCTQSTHQQKRRRVSWRTRSAAGKVSNEHVFSL